MIYNKDIHKENNLFTLVVIFILLFTYICSITFSFFGFFDFVSFNNFGKLTIPSVLFFVVICIFAFSRKNFFFLFLIPVLLAFPSPIDDIFPSVIISNPDDRYRVVFPIITRIDIYLVFGIILRLFDLKFKIRAFKFTLLIKLFLFLFLSVFVVNIFKSNDFKDFYLLMVGSFHIRYFVLIFFLINIYNIRLYEKEIIMGFVISLIFLLIEALVNTEINNIDRLTSGSLALNVFANIAVAILVFIIYLTKYNRINNITAFISSFTVLIIIIGSGTRGAMLSFFFSIILLNILETPKKAVKKIILTGSVIILLFTFYLKALEMKLIPDRYSYSYISNRVNINFNKNKLTEIVKIKPSYETNSIIARLNLFESSINMISINPLTGIGVGRWNRYKNTYSDGNKVHKVLIDSHNDYFSLLSQYGIPLGLIISYLVFLYPFKVFRQQKKDSITAFHLLFVINFTMGVAALSNSGFFKHQIAAILLFCVCVSDQIIYENRMSNDF